MTMNIIVAEIENALQKRCFLPALALTLVIPDVCAQFDYPNIYSKKEEYQGRKGQGAAYAKWYDENVRKYELPDMEQVDLSIDERKQYEDYYEKTTLKGKHCWKLRCELLHNIYLDIDDEMSADKDIVNFKFIVPEETESIWGGSTTIASTNFNNINAITIELNISIFCKKIIEIFRNTYLTNQKFIDSTELHKLNYTIEKI